ncbi:hypothetical protein FKG94_14995 [Exilibacterium tricleocarpae]|uniref:PhoP regulatory network protein YrbL n=1 Tax=Exilibacterium tricleocarpae TaxID=2591008 RepID=A0A545TKB5_9GAMM|nr:hypothetical protein FKG94_14995 [Exilibacterium tricleocarpae]
MAGLEPFARGGNRLCFVNPDNCHQCVKVARPGFSAAEKRRKKSFPKSLKPLSSFDDNLQEYRTLTAIHRRSGDPVLDLIPRCYGLVPTDCGPGIVTDLITDADGRISITLKQYLWEQGITPTLRQSLEQFRRQWSTLAVPSRDLLLHNVVVQQTAGGALRLMVIDGLGWSDLIPLAQLLPVLARRKALRKLDNLEARMQTLLTTKQRGGPWGYHGYLEPRQRRIENDDT